jgi:hypothetical protein
VGALGRAPTRGLSDPQLRGADVQQRDGACAPRVGVRDRFARLDVDRGLDRPLDLGQQQRPARDRALLQLREQLDGGLVAVLERADRDRLGLERGRGLVEISAPSTLVSGVTQMSYN